MRLLNQDLFRKGNCRKVLILLARVLFLNAEDAKGAIKTSREESRVVIRYSQTLNWQGMSLNLEYLFVRVAHDLDRTRFVLLGYTSEDSSSVVHQHDLGESHGLLIPELLLSVLKLSDSLVSTCGVDQVFLVLLSLLTERGHTGVVDVLDLVLPDRSLLVKLPQENSGIPTRGHKACIVIQPRDRSDKSRVVFELVVRRVLSGVEFVHINV